GLRSEGGLAMRTTACGRAMVRPVRARPVGSGRGWFRSGTRPGPTGGVLAATSGAPPDGSALAGPPPGGGGTAGGRTDAPGADVAFGLAGGFAAGSAVSAAAGGAAGPFFAAVGGALAASVSRRGRAACNTGTGEVTCGMTGVAGRGGAATAVAAPPPPLSS